MGSVTTMTVGVDNVAGLWTTYIIRKAIPGLKGNLILADYARPAMIPKGVGGYIGRWLVPTMRRGSTTPIADGSATISATAMVTITSVEATIADYGEWFPTGDLAMNTEITEALDIYADIVAYAGATCIDDLLYNEACSTARGFSNYFASRDTTINTAGMTHGDTLILPDLAYARAFMLANDAPGFQSLNGDYLVLIHPNQEVNMITDVTSARLSWAEQNKYVPAGYEKLVDANRLVGRWGGMSIQRSTTTGQSVTHGVFAYKSLLLADWGLGWLGVGESGPKAPRIIRKSPGPNSTNDPLETMHTLGWKVRAVARVLDRASRGLIIYSSKT
jgi:N4-gp56 family major capsid protein